MSSTKFYMQVVLGLILMNSEALAKTHAVTVQQSSLKTVLISCKPPGATEKSPSTVLVYEDAINGASKWMMVSKIGKTQTEETRNLSVNPKYSFSKNDAWTGASRFMKSFDLKTKHSHLQISSQYDPKRGAYGAYYNGYRFFCSLEKSVPETFAAIRQKTGHENSNLQASNRKYR